MGDIYSPALLVSLVCLIVALFVSIDLRYAFLPLRPAWKPYLYRFAQIATGISLVAMLAALVSHVLRGHQPGSDNAMGLIEFIVEHPILPSLAVMIAIAGWFARWHR